MRGLIMLREIIRLWSRGHGSRKLTPPDRAAGDVAEKIVPRYRACIEGLEARRLFSVTIGGVSVDNSVGDGLEVHSPDGRTDLGVAEGETRTVYTSASARHVAHLRHIAHQGHAAQVKHPA